MARIPLYDQQQLASSQVGTPGVDTSTASAFQSVAQDAGQMKNAVYSFANQEYQLQQAELRQRQAELRQIERELKNAQRDAEVGGYASGLSVKLNTLDNELRVKHQWNTDGAVEDFTKNAQGMADAELEKIQDPLTKLKAQKSFQNEVARYQNGLSDWSKTRTLPIIESQIKGMAGDLATKLKDSTQDWSAAGVELEAYDQKLNLYSTLYGPQGKEKLREDQEAAIKERISDMAIRGVSSEELDKALENPLVKKYTDPSAMKPFVTEQRTIAAQERQAKALEEKMTFKANNMTARETVVNLTPTGDPRDISAADFQAFKKSEEWGHLTTAQKIEIEKAVKEGQTPEYQLKKEKAAAKVVNTQKAAVDDKVLVGSVGRQVGWLNKQSTELMTDFLAVTQKGRKYTDAEVNRLAGKLDKYQEAYLALTVMAKNVTTPEAKALVSGELSNIQRDMDTVKKFLTNRRAATQEQTYRNAIRQAVGRENPYSDPRKRALYDYHYRTYFDAKFDTLAQQGKLKDLRLNTPRKQPDGKVMGALDALRLQLKTYAAQQVERAGFYRGK